MADTWENLDTAPLNYFGINDDFFNGTFYVHLHCLDFLT